jgi:lipoprotein-anchoring transpeptidase ErfK/SrfK
MNSARMASLCFLVAAASVTWSAWQAQAQAPVFKSDIERHERELEAQREARRKTYGPTVYPKFMDGGAKPDIAPAKPPVVYLEKNEAPGTIIVDTGGRKLYYVLPGKEAFAYPISVGRDGFTWTGTEKISRVVSWPSWTPPPEMRQRQPGLPITVSGGTINPLGAKALYLGSSIYRIHGTNNERSIGKASSSGCFRMMNEHVTHLATLARVGTTVRVVSNYSGASESAPLSSVFSGFGFGSDDPPVPQKKVKAKAKK